MQAWVCEGSAGRPLPPWILKLVAKKVVFSISRGKNKFHHFSPFVKSPVVPPQENILPTPMYAGADKGRLK